MKVLTVWQPWASLIAIGAKPFEFRGRVPPPGFVGERIAIHAGARKPVVKEIAQLLNMLHSHFAWQTCLRPDLALPFLEAVLAQPERLPLGHILCTAILGTAQRGDLIATEFGGPAVNDSERSGHFNFGWPLSDIEELVPPVEFRGRQGWGDWSPK